MGSANKEKASRISASSSAVMPFSLASFERRVPDLGAGLEAAAAEDAPAAGLRRRGGCFFVTGQVVNKCLFLSYFL